MGFSIYIYAGFLKWGYPQNHYIKIGFSFVNHHFWGYPHVWKAPYGGFLFNAACLISSKVMRVSASHCLLDISTIDPLGDARSDNIHVPNLGGSTLYPLYRSWHLEDWNHFSCHGMMMKSE